MNKEEILQKSREENAAAFLDEREKGLRLCEDSFALGTGMVFAFLLFCIKVYRGQPAADMLALVMGMSAAGAAHRAVREKKKSYWPLAVITAGLTVLYFIRFLLGGM